MISIITPIHETSNKFLRETYECLKEQTFEDWEWILLENAGGEVKDLRDPRIKVFQFLGEKGGIENSIGELKRVCCDLATGDILLELDADDLLSGDALEKVAEAFEDPEIHMVYSNDAEFEDGTWIPHVYGKYWGWRIRPVTFKGHELQQMVAWPPSVHMMRLVYWAPDHVRAWRAESYEKVGGHNPKLAVGDDHDLCCRFYLRYGARGLKHIDECLYFYRKHPTQGIKLRNAAIQDQTLKNYLGYSRDMITRWADDEGLLKLDLGGRFDRWEGYTTVDLIDADIKWDLEKRWPFEDNSVGVIKAYHIFEHLEDQIHTMSEAFRVLAPGGWLLVEVPSTDGRGAFQDPTHKTFWNENSFWYYTRESHARYIRPQFEGRFQASRIVTYFPTDFEKVNDIPIVQADLIALKPPYDERPVGEVLI